MPVVFKISSNVSFFNSACLLVRKSMTTKDRVLGSTASTNSGIGSISLSLKYFVYFSTLSLSVCVNCDDQETGVAGGFCAGWIELAIRNEADDKSSGFSEGEGFRSLLKMPFCEFCEFKIGSSIVA